MEQAVNDHRNAAAQPINPYENPQAATYMGAFEGVPEWPWPVESEDEQKSRAAWQKRAHAGLVWLGAMLPGLGLAAALAVAGLYLSSWIGHMLHTLLNANIQKSPVSPILLAILLGLVVRNTAGLPATYEKGLRLCLKKILRVGIALLGIRLSLMAVGAIGLVSLPIVFGCILTALVLVSLITRLLDLSPRLGSLIAVGTSICGVSAIVATSPVIDAEDSETSYAVATITIFGMTALFVYPFLSHWMFHANANFAGLFLGTSIHDMAQVTGSGLMYQQQYGAKAALSTALVTKMVRNLCMLWVIPLMGILYHRRGAGEAGTGAAAGPSRRSMVPMFMFGFVAMALLRTVGDLGGHAFGVLSHADWNSLIDAINRIATWCLALAMAAVGLGTSFKKLRNLGLKPFAVGFAAAAMVGLVSFVLVEATGPLLWGLLASPK